MFIYFIRRLMLLIPTFLGITVITFALINLAPGSPVEQKLQQMRFGGGETGASRTSQAATAEVVAALNKQYGFDKPLHERYMIWLTNLAHFDFGQSFTYEEPVTSVIASKFPVSLSFGLASLFLTYIVCIPLGVLKARKAGGTFDHISGLLLYFTYSIPPLVLGIFLIVMFAGSTHLGWFPIGGFQSEDYQSFSVLGKIGDRIYHFILPITCYMIGGFTEISMLMRNSMLDVINSDYVRTARAKGLSEKRVVFKHALRNALIPIITGLSAYFAVFLAGSLIIEQIFNLDGIGLLSYNSILSRDYNVIMGLTFISSLVLLGGRIISDFIYVLVDPRIDFK